MIRGYLALSIVVITTSFISPGSPDLYLHRIKKKNRSLFSPLPGMSTFLLPYLLALVVITIVMFART